jgi:coproporphyrinogen III oxidase-like Fe-S oxidoreductase
MLGLRLNRGVSVSALERRLAGRLPSNLKGTLHRYVQRGLLERTGSCYRLTAQVRLMSDCLFADLVE